LEIAYNVAFLSSRTFPTKKQTHYYYGTLFAADSMVVTKLYITKYTSCHSSIAELPLFSYPD